ncbi:MAG TPA: alpha-E domain-containing protein [Pirellulaceae bacterium]|nr:alpha-E domain-containing protein [Pirellulaceae bacterium]
MLSRVADSVFWMCRYIERAENVARFIDVNHNLTLEFGDSLEQPWWPLVMTTGDDEQFRELYTEVTRENVIQFLTFDRRNPNSILSCLNYARENARQIRDSLSLPWWEELNKFYLMIREATLATALEDHYEFYNRIKLASHLLIGIAEATVSHGEFWHFARLSRSLERADKTSRILDVKYFILQTPVGANPDTPIDTVQWAALLKSAGAMEMYRKQHGRISPRNVVDFLVLDRCFPRSFHYCLVKAEESLHTITGTADGTFRNKAEQRLGRLRSELDYTHIDDIFAQGLHDYIDSFQSKLNLVAEAICDHFFGVPAAVVVKAAS